MKLTGSGRQRGNVSKACKIDCQEMIPACTDDTVQKLCDLHPERSLNLNVENLPSPESLNTFWDGDHQRSSAVLVPVLIQSLKQLHGNLLTHYNCTEWAPPLADDAPAPDVPAQGHDNNSTRPLSLPQLNLLASLRVRQDEDNGKVAACPSLPPQRQVTKHIMQTWHFMSR